MCDCVETAPLTIYFSMKNTNRLKKYLCRREVQYECKKHIFVSENDHLRRGSPAQFVEEGVSLGCHSSDCIDDLSKYDIIG